MSEIQSKILKRLEQMIEEKDNRINQLKKENEALRKKIKTKQSVTDQHLPILPFDVERLKNNDEGQ